MAREYEKRGVAVLGVASANMGPMDESRTRNFVTKVGIGGAVALDTTAQVYQSYDRLVRGGAAVAPFPRQFVLDAEGRVVYASPRYDPAALRKVLDSLPSSRS